MAPLPIKVVSSKLQDMSSYLKKMKKDRSTEDDEMAAALRAERRMISDEKIEKISELSSEYRIQRMEAAMVGWQQETQHQSPRALQQIIADENAEFKTLDKEIAAKDADAIYKHQALVSDLKRKREEGDLLLKKKIGAFVTEQAGPLSKLTSFQFQALDGDIQTFITNEIDPVALAWNGLQTPDDTPPAFNKNRFVGGTNLLQVPPTPTPSSRKSRSEISIRPLKSLANRNRVGLGITGEKDIYGDPYSDSDESIIPLAKHRKMNNSPIINIEEESAVDRIVAVTQQSPRTAPSTTTSAPSSPLQLLEISSRETTPEDEDIQIFDYASASDYEETQNQKKRNKGRAPITTDNVEIHQARKKDRLHLGDIIAKPSVTIPFSQKSISYSVWSRRVYVPHQFVKFMVNIVHVRKGDGEVSVWNDAQSELTFFLARQEDKFVPVIGHRDKAKIHPEFVFDPNKFHSMQWNSYNGLLCITNIYRVNPDAMIAFDSRQDLWNFLSVIKIEFVDRKILLQENVDLIMPESWVH